MNLKQLEAFEAISTLHTTIAAAQKLEISQSAVSRLLAQLEDDLGLSLFVREQGRLTPTRQGEALVQEVQTIIEAARCLQRHAQQLRLGGLRRTLIRAMVPNTLTQHLLPALVERFCAAHQDAVLEVVSGTYGQAERALLSREVDLGFVRFPASLPGLAEQFAIDTQAVCIMPPEHPLAALDTVSATDLDGVPMVLLWRQSALRHEIDMTFRSARINPLVIMEVHSVALACSIVSRKLGVAIVNRLLADCCVSDTFAIRPFTPAVKSRIGIATLAAAPVSAKCQAFVTELSASLLAVRDSHARPALPDQPAAAAHAAVSADAARAQAPELSGE